MSRFRSLRGELELVAHLADADVGEVSAGSVCSAKRAWPAVSVSRSFSASRADLDLGAVGQLAHDVVQHVGGNGHGAGLGDVGGDAPR